VCSSSDLEPRSYQSFLGDCRFTQSDIDPLTAHFPQGRLPSIVLDTILEPNSWSDMHPDKLPISIRLHDQLAGSIRRGVADMNGVLSHMASYASCRPLPHSCVRERAMSDEIFIANALVEICVACTL
jgi:hypothetical protein